MVPQHDGIVLQARSPSCCSKARKPFATAAEPFTF
jgi:hypothetical protein